MTIFSFPCLSLCCVVSKPRKVVLICVSNKHLMLPYSMVQRQNLVKTTSFVANWTSQKQTVQQAAVGCESGGTLYVQSDLLDGACILQIVSFNITGNTRDWMPQTVLANSVIYCTKLSAAEKLMGSPHKQGSKVKTRQNSSNRKNNLSKREEKRYNLQK